MILHGIPRFFALSIAYALGLLQITFAISTSGLLAKYSAILCKLVPPPEPTGVELNYFEQQTEIEVTSSEDWTLEGDYSWVTPSTVSGKNGDVVVFSVNANTTGKTRTASYTFKVTGAQTKAVIKQTAGEVEMTLGLTAVSSGDEDVTLALNVESKDIDRKSVV